MKRKQKISHYSTLPWIQRKILILLKIEEQIKLTINRKHCLKTNTNEKSSKDLNKLIKKKYVKINLDTEIHGNATYRTISLTLKGMLYLQKYRDNNIKNNNISKKGIGNGRM